MAFVEPFDSIKIVPRHFSEQCNEQKWKRTYALTVKRQRRTSASGWEQGLQFRLVLLGTGGTYRSARLSVRGPPATEWYCQKSTVDGRLREESTVGGRLREKLTVGGRLKEKSTAGG
ncbi:hypothetical protein B296_00032434 [Ensete ventricosum]|uniref:Uncharacterized protein n=1 Tax=Ensete ventricosum TaxID=4639 RepID=A0A426Y9R1_ENSVE|nr:hypothetical protein B296_00032434 [Ensete ventricosum]